MLRRHSQDSGQHVGRKDGDPEHSICLLHKRAQRAQHHQEPPCLSSRLA